MVQKKRLNLKNKGRSTSRNNSSEKKMKRSSADKFAYSPQKVLDNISDGFFILNDDLVTLYFNKAAEKLLGRKKEDVLGKQLFEVFPQAKGSEFEKNYRKAIKIKKPLSFETYFGKKPYDDWYDVRIYPQENGIAVYFRITTQDKKTEEQFKLNSQLLEESQTIGNIGTWTIDVAKNNIKWTSQVYDIFGLKEGIKIDYAKFLKYVHPEDRDYVNSAWNNGAKTGSYDIEHRILVNKKVKWVREKATIKTDKKGNAVSAIGIVQNITERKKAEEKIENSEKKYRDLIENSLEGTIVVAGAPPKILLVNKALCVMLGYSEKEFLSMGPKQIAGLIHKDDRDSFFKRYSDRMKGKEVESKYEIRALRKDGSVRWLMISSRLTTFENVPAVQASFVDLTEQKLTENKLKESESRFKTIVEHTSEMMYIHDTKHVLSYVSPASKKVFGYTPEEMMINWTKLTTNNPINKKGFEKTVKAIETGEKQEPYYLELTKKNGELMTCLIDESPLKDEKGNIIGITGILRDVTKEYRAEVAIKENEEKFRTIFESSQDGILLLDPASLKYIDANPAAIKMFGYKKKSKFIGKFVSDCSPKIQPEGISSKKKAQDLLKEFFKKGHAEFEWTHIKKNGDEFNTSINISKFIIDKKECMIAAVRDTTKEKKAEEELRKMQYAIESSNDAIGMSTPDGKHFYQNKAFSDLFGYSSPKDLDHYGGGTKLYRDKKIAKKVFSNIMSGKSWKGEVDMISKQGELLPVDLHADAIKDTEGKLVGLIGIHRDISRQKKAEEELKHSEENYRNVFENANEAILILQDKRISYCNMKTSEIIGWSLDKLLGRKFLDLIHPDDKGRIVKYHIKRIFGMEVPTQYRFKALHKSGKTVYLDVTAARIIWQGKPAAMTFMTDVTDEMKIDSALKESEYKYRTLTENMLEGVAIIDSKGHVLFANSAARKITGLENEKNIKGFSALSMIDVNDRKRAKKNLAKTFLGNISTSNEYKLSKDCKSSTCWVELISRAINYQGKRAALVTFRDISERKMIEENLKESERKYSSIFSHLTSGFSYHKIIKNARGKPVDYKFIEINDSFEKITGIKRKDIIGKCFTEVFPNVEKETHDLIQVYGNTAITGKSIKFEKKWKSKNKWFHISVYSPKKDYFVTIFDDITESKRSQEILKEAYEELKKIDELKSQLLRDVSHELRSPISIINMSSDIIVDEMKKNRPDMAKIRKYILMSKRHSNIFSEQIGHIVELSKLQNIKRLTKSNVDIKKIIEESILDIKPIAENKKLKLTSKIDKLPKISAEQTLLRSLMRNLLSNAVKFTEKGSITVSAKKNSQQIFISISDTGAGISESEVDKVFDAFTQHDPSIDGLGIGLTICKNIVDLHGGEITLKSKIKKGSEFTVQIPIK